MQLEQSIEMDLNGALRALQDLTLQVSEFCAANGEADFELAGALQVLGKHGLAAAVSKAPDSKAGPGLRAEFPAGWWLKRVGQEILVTGPVGGMHLKATGGGLGNRLLYSFADDLLTYQSVEALGTNPAAALAVPLVQRTAPESIYLQVSDQASDCAKAFPNTNASEVTWSSDSAQACEVQYIRADLANS